MSDCSNNVQITSCSKCLCSWNALSNQYGHIQYKKRVSVRFPFGSSHHSKPVSLKIYLMMFGLCRHRLFSNCKFGKLAFVWLCLKFSAIQKTSLVNKSSDVQHVVEYCHRQTTK